MADDDPIETAFARLLAGWDDPEEHRRFQALSLTLDRLAEAGRRYREVRDTDASRRAVAEAQIDRLFGLAIQKLEATRSLPVASRPPILLYVAIGVAASLVFGAAYALLHGV